MRFCRMCLALVLLVVVALATDGCAGEASISNTLSGKGITRQSFSVLQAELRFLKESKGSNYLYTDLAGNADFLDKLYLQLTSSKPADKPDARQYSPELRSDYEIALSDGSGIALTIYVVAQDNLVVIPDRKDSKDGETLDYLFFNADSSLTALLQEQKKNAKLKKEDKMKPFRSMEELLSSIDAEELAEEGKELNFEFYTEIVPENAGTACRIYSSADYATLPADSLLVTAYGKTKTGEQQKLSIVGIEANTYYTKIIVSEPDEALESVDTGEAAPESFAATIQKNSIDVSKWIVFVDGENRILDVIVPEDIEGIGDIPPGNQSPEPSSVPPESEDVAGSGDE